MPEKKLYRVVEAAELLSLSRAKLYQLIARGRLRVVHIDHAARIPAEELDRFVRDLQEANGGERKESSACAT